MKLILAILRAEDAGAVTTALLEKEYRLTKIASTGGFLRRGNTTLLVGVEAEQVDDALAVMKAACAPPEEGHDRAVAFVLDATQAERL